MKKIITSVGMIAFVAAIVAGGTGAFFSDTETSRGNTFTAGAIDLKVDSVAHYNGMICFDSGEGFSAGYKWHPGNTVVWNDTLEKYELTGVTNGAALVTAINTFNTQNPALNPQAGDDCEGTWALADLNVAIGEDDEPTGPSYTFFNYGDLKPGDSGENTISLHVYNNDAYMCAVVENVATNDNGITEPEGEAGDNNDGVGNGELQNELEMVIWRDDGDNILEEGETILVETDSADGIAGIYDLFTSATGVLPAQDTAYLGVYWCYGDATRNGTTLSCDGSSVSNISQTDSLMADIRFYVEQARHNEEFTCVQREPVVSWTDDGSRTGGSATIIPDETATKGDNVLRLLTVDDVDSRVRYNYDVADIDLSDFTGFSFNSKQVSAFDPVNGNASFRLVVDLDGDSLTLGDIKDVTFEPYYNFFVNNDMNPASITTGIWQTWAATMAKGKFWAGGVTTVLGPSEGAGGAYATNFTIQQLLDAYPSAKILGISIGMGTYNKDQVVHVDSLIFNGVELGFE